jgi:putative addiction module component (TIGR02574 family)
MSGNEVPETNQIIASALQLSFNDRIALVNAMLESVEGSSESVSQTEIDNSWKDEIAKRVQEIKSGKVNTISSSELWEQIGGKPNA